MPISGGGGIIVVTTLLPDPSQIFLPTNLMAWLDAADNFSGTTALDRTANHNNFFQIGGAPFISPVSFNGKAGYNFSATFGTGLFDNGVNGDNFPPIGTSGAIFCTLRVDTTVSTFPRIFSFAQSPVGDDNNTASICMGCNDAGAQPNVGALFNSTGNASSPNFSFGSYHRVGVVWNPTTVWTYFDNAATDGGVAASLNVSGAITSPFTAAFGAAKNGGNNLNGQMGDMVVVNVTPTTTQLNQLDAYFRDRYGI